MKTKIKYLLVLVLASFVFVGCGTTHESEIKNWEYKTITTYPTGQALNQLGKDGWQLVSVVPLNVDDILVNGNSSQRSLNLAAAICIFKRPLH